MKTEFRGYYAPSEVEFKTLWSEGLIVLDTNVLLDLYRLPASARDELLSVLELLKDRLWIPYQVALEFQRRRLTVIASERKASEEALSDANDLFEEVRKRVVSLQIDKRGLNIESQPLLDELKAANDKLISAINAVHQAQLDIAVSDPVRDKLDSLLADKVGPPPSEQAELDRLTEDGDNRYLNKIPPGFGDLDKEKNPNEAAFYHDGLRYERKFGDLIIWRQLLQYAEANGIAAILLVTADRKDDWWWREKGKTIGPRPELAREMCKEGKVNLFWMYSSVQFLSSAKSFTDASISPESLSELEEVVRVSPREITARKEQGGIQLPRPKDRNLFSLTDFLRIENAVLNWLKRRFGEVRRTRSFPDFVVDTPEGFHGFEVKFVRDFSRFLFSPSVVQAMLRGYVEVAEGRLNQITVVTAVNEVDAFPLFDGQRLDELHRRLDSLLDRYPIDEIIVGFVDSSEEFFAITKRGKDRTISLQEYNED